MKYINTIIFDADDTLWECEPFFQQTKQFVCYLLKDYADEKTLKELIYKNHISKLDLYGYGIKGYILSLIKTALDVSDMRVDADVIDSIVALGDTMLNDPIVLLPGVEKVLKTLKPNYRLVMITKGDLLDQMNKLKRSGLEHYFEQVEVVSEKDEVTYKQVFEKMGIEASSAMMVGNSLKSDVLPVVAIGGTGVHIPYEITWDHEKTDKAIDSDRIYELKTMGELVILLKNSQCTKQFTIHNAQCTIE